MDYGYGDEGDIIWIDGASWSISMSQLNEDYMDGAYFDGFSEEGYIAAIEAMEKQEKKKEKKKQKEKFSLEQKEIIKLIAGANNNLVIKDKVSRYVYKCEFNIKIDKYVEKEELPIIFVDMAKQKDGLYIILKNFFIKNCNFTPYSDLVNDVITFTKYIYTDVNDKIVYDQVSIIQKFIHTKVQEDQGKNAHLNLNKLLMKNILSACRLHLEIHYFKYKDIDLLLEQNSITEKEANTEIYNPKKRILLPTQKYVPIWRVKGNHIRSPFSDILFSKKKLELINSISIFQSTKEYKCEILKIFE